MYLSADRLAIANRTVAETFEQTSVAWQAIPHWETGDPAQTKVRPDNVNDPTAPFLTFTPLSVEFDITLAQAIAPTPDALLASVMAKTAVLARNVDVEVVTALRSAASPVDPALAGTNPPAILNALIGARADVEDAGYRAPSCLLVNTLGLQALSVLESGYPVTEALLTAANVNALHRVTTAQPPDTDPLLLMLVLGRRQRITLGGAAEASPGEEPVDLAVSVHPGLEVIGDTPEGNVRLAVRVSFAPRINDDRGVVAISGSLSAEDPSSEAGTSTDAPNSF